MPYGRTFRRALCTLSVLVSAYACLANASSATLLLEEPYGKLGFFTATGHAAVYLSGVCAETPVKLRPCAGGELGAVISRYDGVHGYDWVAVPLIPYLYAVDQPEDIPLFADPKLVYFLRDQYRRKHFEDLAPDTANEKAPGGNWYELVGSSYDRAIYGFEIETTSERDMAFIQEFNARRNISHFHLTYRNCADFSKDVINFYYPKTLHRSIVADAGITTPKQIAKLLIRFSGRHDDLKFSRFVIPQIPGSAARSTAVHGVVESFLKSKKYIVPTAVVNPVLAGCVVAVYLGTGAGRFDPAHQALVYNAGRELEPPLGNEDRRSYQSELNHLDLNHVELKHLVTDLVELNLTREEKLGRLLRAADPAFDADGRPILRVQFGDEKVNVGIANSNIFSHDTAGPFTEQILQARLYAELKRGHPPKASASDVTRDWDLFQKALYGDGAEMTAHIRRSAQITPLARSEANLP